MSDAAANLKTLKRQLGACEDTIRIQKQTRRSLLRKIGEAREDDPEAFAQIFPEVLAAERRRQTSDDADVSVD